MKAAKPIALLAVLLVLALSAFVLIGRSQQTNLLVGQVTAAPLQGRPGAVGVFFDIHNKGAPDRLISARSIVAKRAWLESAVADAGLPIPANSTPALVPDGAFVLMDGVGGDLDEGRMIPITLQFEKAGEIRTQARLLSPRDTGDAERFGLFGIGDICQVGEGEPAPDIDVSVEPKGDDWQIRVTAKDFTFSQDMIDGPHVPGTGHAHLYLGGLKLKRLFDPETRIGPLPPGKHEVRVTLNPDGPRAYVVGALPVTATALITVPSP